MAVIAKAEMTVSHMIDVVGTYRFYLLQSSTASAPLKPTTYPPASPWGDTEPTYTSESTNSLYFVDCTVYSNNTFDYSPVSLSTSYEAAKEAYNKATNAQNAAEVAKAMGVEYIVGTQTASTNAWKGTTTDASLSVGKTIAYKLPYAGTSSSASLNLTLSDGTTTGAKGIRRMTSTVTTNYPAESVIWMTYDGTYWRITDYNSDTYDRIKYSKAIKCGTTAIVAGNIIVGTGGLYKHLKAGTAFDVSYPILYASSAIDASATGTNNYTCISFTVTTTQSITLTAYKPVYIKGTLSGTSFTPVSTSPLTQTIPTSDDGYYYILLGQATASNNVYLMPEHPIYKYFNGGFKAISQIAVEASRTATDHMEFGGDYGDGLVIADLTGDTLGRNIHIQSDGIDLRSGQTVLATFQEDLIELGAGNKEAEISLCDGLGRIGLHDGDTNYNRLSIHGNDAVYLWSEYGFYASTSHVDPTGKAAGARISLESGAPWAYDENVAIGEVFLTAESTTVDSLIQSYLQMNEDGVELHYENTTNANNMSWVRLRLRQHEMFLQAPSITIGLPGTSDTTVNGPLTTSSSLTVNGDLYMNNGKYIYSKFADNSDCTMMWMNASDQMGFGYGSYTLKKGSVYIDGNTLNLRSNSTILLNGYDVPTAIADTNGYYQLSEPVGRTSHGWIRTPVNGILPNKTGGSSYIGATTWPFTAGYFNNVYVGGTAVSVSSHTHASLYNNSQGANVVTTYRNSSSVLSLIPNASYQINLGLSTDASTRYGYIYLRNNPNVSSDIRLKENIDYDMDKYIAMLDRLKPMSFTWIDERDNPNAKRNLSYGAQYVWMAMKEVGLEEKDFGGFSKDISDEGSVYSYSLALEQMIPILHARQDRDKAELLKRIERIEKALGISDAS